MRTCRDGDARTPSRRSHSAGHGADGVAAPVGLIGPDQILESELPMNLRRNTMTRGARVALVVLAISVLGLPVQAQDARADWRVRAEAGEAAAQFTLGVMYYEGKGGPQDFVEAAAWFRQAAEQGHAGAQLNLGSMYSFGFGDLPQDDIEVSIIIINPGLDSRARTALEHMLESVVSARGKVAEDELLGDQPSKRERPS